MFENCKFTFKYGARQNLHRHSSGARRRQIVVCRQRARRLSSMGPTKSTSAFIRSPTVANCCLPSTGPTSAVNGPNVCCQRTRQNLHWHLLGARQWQIAVCRQRARHLLSTGLMSAVNAPDKPIQTNYAMSAIDGPDICHWQAWCLLSRGQTSANNLHNVCHQLAENLLSIGLIKEILASWQAHILVNWLDQVRLG